MNSLAKQINTAILLGACIILQSGCGKSTSDETPLSESSAHTYELNISNGESLTGQVPKEMTGVYNIASLIDENQEEGQKTVAIVLQEAGKAQVRVGLLLDDNNRPTAITKNSEGKSSSFRFGKWGEELEYTAIQCIFSLKEYQEHSVSAYGDEGTVASLSLDFEGIFKASTTDEEVEVNGIIKIAAP